MFISGYGIFATKTFQKKEFLLEYPGDLLCTKDAEVREDVYKKTGKGCFMYHLKHQEKRYW